MFTDESTIAVLDDRVQTLRRRSGEEYLPACLKKTVKFPAKIMVWRDMLFNGISRLHIIEGTMNQIKYLGRKYVEVQEGRLL